MISHLITRSILCALLAVFISACGCRSYPEVTSAESQNFIKQVYTACNTMNAERVAKCVERLNELTTQKLISENEAATFDRILKLAQSQDWQAAQEQSLAFAQRQVR